MAGDVYNNKNVLIGAGTLWVNGANMGWTKDGVEIEHTGEFYFVEVDQEPSPVKGAQIGEGYKIKTNLVELTLENLKIAWGIDNEIDDTGTAGRRILKFGGASTDLVEKELVVKGKAPGTDRERTITFYKVISVDFGTMVMNKNAEAVTPVTFQALIDSSKPAGEQIGEFSDQTTDGTKNLVSRVTVTN